MNANELEQARKHVVSMPNDETCNIRKDGVVVKTVYRLFNQPMPADDDGPASRFLTALETLHGDREAWEIVLTGLALYYREGFPDKPKTKVSDAAVERYVGRNLHEFAQRLVDGASMSDIHAEVRKMLTSGAMSQSKRDCDKTTKDSVSKAMAAKVERILSAATEKDSNRIGTTG